MIFWLAFKLSVRDSRAAFLLLSSYEKQADALGSLYVFINGLRLIGHPEDEIIPLFNETGNVASRVVFFDQKIGGIGYLKDKGFKSEKNLFILIYVDFWGIIFESRTRSLAMSER